MSEYYQFDDKAVQEALAAASEHNNVDSLKAVAGSVNAFAAGEYSVLAQCISVTVGNHKICLNLPLGIGKVCIPLPVNVPNGTAAQACLSICTTFGIPTGIRVTISVLGHVIVKKTFGRC